MTPPSSTAMAKLLALLKKYIQLRELGRSQEATLRYLTPFLEQLAPHLKTELLREIGVFESGNAMSSGDAGSVMLDGTLPTTGNLEDETSGVGTLRDLQALIAANNARGTSQLNAPSEPGAESPDASAGLPGRTEKIPPSVLLAARAARNTLICPHCKRANALGTAVCAHCGKSLLPSDEGLDHDSTQDTDHMRLGSAFHLQEYFGVEAALVLTTVPVAGELSHTFRAQPQSLNRPLLVGRSDPNTRPDVDLTPAGASRFGVSRRHVQITHQPDHHTLIINDLTSANGTFINGQRLYPGETRTLRHNDELRLAKLVLRVSFFN